MKEYSKSIFRVDFTMGLKGVRMNAFSGLRTGIVPSSGSCSFYFGLALTCNALVSRSLPKKVDLTDDRDGQHIFD